MWDEMDVPTELNDWASQNGPFDDKDNTFPLLFGEPLGIAETFGRDCKTIEANCITMNCEDMGVWQDAGSAWEYLVVVSVTNLNMVSPSEHLILEGVS